MKFRYNRTASEIHRLGFREPFLRSKGGPFIKLLNWSTGFGKTYTASVFAIELYIDADVIPVFIAPLQSLVKGFADDVKRHAPAQGYADEIEKLLRQRGETVLVHRLYSREYHENDRTFFQAAIWLHGWLHSNPDAFSELSKGDKSTETRNGISQAVDDMRRKSRICLESSFHNLHPSDDTYEDALAEYTKAAARAAISAAERVVRRLITLDVGRRTDDQPRPTIIAAEPVAEMVRRLRPLQGFLDHPGIIVSTASKSQVKQEVYAYDEKLGRNKWLKFETLPEFLRELNRDGSLLGKRVSRRPDSARVVMFVDEEEDSYWYLFDQRKSVFNSEGRNDLNVVITEFFTFLDLKWPIGFEKGGDQTLARKVYEHLEKIADVSQLVWNQFEAEKTLAKAKHILEPRRVEIFRTTFESAYPQLTGKFTAGELLEVLQRLVDQNDAHNRFQRFREKARVLARLRDTFVGSLSQAQAIPPYAAYRRLRELVVDKKYFTMSRASYGEVLDQPGQTFFSGESNIMATEFLRQVELRPETGDQTIRLVYHEGEMVAGAFTLYNYLELVLFIAKVLNVESGDDAVAFAREDLERYPALARFRTEVRRLFRTNVATEGLRKESFEDELLTEAFFFNGTKSVVTLEESRRQADEYNLPADVSLTVTITSLRDTPEEDIVQAIGRSNGVYLMSATGGLSGVSSGAFNVGQLQRVLQAKGGHFNDMTDAELEVVAAKATELLARRERQFTILNDDEPAMGFEVSMGYKGLQNTFHMALPQREAPEYAYLNTYKRHEIDGLVASLDVLLSTDVRSGLVLCQTVTRVQTALMNLARGGAGWVDQVDHDGHVFRINPRHLPRYRSAQDDVTLVLYTARRFRSRDKTKTGAVPEADDDGQFSEELVNALDITNKKVLLWTAYGSASRGMNFITKQHGEERDFELFCLLNDPYYTRHTRPGKHGFTMETFQSYLQVLRDEGDAWGGMTKRDLLFEYSKNRWKRLRKEHYVDITRQVFQALGRGERRPDEGMPRQRVYLSAQAAHMVHLGTRYAPELVRRASPAQRAALAAIEERNRMTALFTSDEERRMHEQESLKRAIRLRQFTSETPRRFRSSEQARTTWLVLFDTRMFTHPTEYIDALKKRGTPAELTDGAYFIAPVSADLYTKEVSTAGISEMILTDAFDGTDVYDWVAMLAPVGLAEHLSPQTRQLLKLRRGFRFDTPDGPMKLWPQPWFVSEIMKGYIAEAEFERFIEEQFGVVPAQMETAGQSLRYIDPTEHPLAAELFQLFDFYLEVPSSDTLVAVDMKNWARSTDRLKKEALQEEAADKYDRLRALLPNRRVKAVYVNLYGAQKFLVNKNVHFMSLYVQTRRNGVHDWIVNENLVNVLLGP